MTHLYGNDSYQKNKLNSDSTVYWSSAFFQNTEIAVILRIPFYQSKGGGRCKHHQIFVFFQDKDATIYHIIQDLDMQRFQPLAYLNTWRRSVINCSHLWFEFGWRQKSQAQKYSRRNKNCSHLHRLNPEWKYAKLTLKYFSEACIILQRQIVRTQ